MDKQQTQELAVQLNKEVSEVLSSTQMIGFQKAFIVSDAIIKIKSMLTDEYMRPIMALQGNKLGFKGDSVYPVDVVRNCLVEAVLIGLQPYGNQFNIIKGQMYPTKEGLGYLLDNMVGLKKEIIPGVPEIKGDIGSVKMTITWSMNGSEPATRELPIVVRVNNGMGSDAVIGKATRKAKMWLYNNLSGIELADADLDELGKETGKTFDYDWNELTILYNRNKTLLEKKEQASAERVISQKEENKYVMLKTLIEKRISEQQNAQ